MTFGFICILFYKVIYCKQCETFKKHIYIPIYLLSNIIFIYLSELCYLTVQHAPHSNVFI